MVSTFPSASDVAWTDMFGDRPLPGYQRTYFSTGANSKIVLNPLATSMERETQMHWQLESSFFRTLGYVFPVHTYKYEVNKFVRAFLKTKSQDDHYYAYIRTPDDAQHLSRDIFAMLCLLEEKLKKVSAIYKARAGRDLEILILSDHGNNRAGAGKRVKVRAFLKKAGYRIARSIVNPKDVVLPTTGIESWVEIHNSPDETERLLQRLTHLEGVDILSAQFPGLTNRFMVMNSKGDRAIIDWNPAKNAFRYSTETGDPLDHLAAVKALASKNQFDADGFATADAWMGETMTHRYPLAVERIVCGHTQVTLNPATILISLDNRYVHSGWLVKKASELAPFGGTHGGLDGLNSDGIVLGNFAPTRDTSTTQVAAQFDDFPGLRDFRAVENGAEWVSAKKQALTRIARVPFDLNARTLRPDEVFLWIWTPRFTHLALETPVNVTVRKARRSDTPIRRGDPKPVDASERCFTLNQPVSFPQQGPCERVYARPVDLILERQKEYEISGWIRDRNKTRRIFKFLFRTDSRGLPVAY
jgi:hypothetical protein